MNPIKNHRAPVQIHRTGKQVFPSTEVKRIVRAVLAGENLSNRSVSVVLMDDAGIQQLNAQFIGHDRPTDVIAFPMDDPDGLLGEVYVSEERAREQAGRFGATFEQEMARLIIHGVLHLVGHDDATPSKKRKMTAIEDSYLNVLGYFQPDSNPVFLTDKTILNLFVFWLSLKLVLVSVLREWRNW